MDRTSRVQWLKARKGENNMHIEIGMTIFVFVMTMIVILWRPGGINEAWPASIGAGIILLTGIVSRGDILDIINKIGGASITIMATIVMAVILESFGFFIGRQRNLLPLLEVQDIAYIGTFNYYVF